MAVSWVEYPAGKAKLRMWFKVKVLYFQVTVLHKLIQDISGGSSDISAIETCTRADTAFTLSLTSCNSGESQALHLSTFSQPLHLSTFCITARVELTGLLLPLGLGFPSGSDSEDSACNAGDLGLIPGSWRSPGERNGHPLQYSCLENPLDRGVWWATGHGVAKNQTRLSY